MDGARSPFPTRLCLVLCALMGAVPFLWPYHNFPFPSFYPEALAFAIGLAALLFMGIATSRRAVPVPAMSLGLLAFVAVLAVQVALGEVAYPLRSAMGALYAIWAALLVTLGAWLGSELGERAVSHALQWSFAVAGTLVAASGFFQYYHTPLLAGWTLAALPLNSMFGLIGQPNNFADYLGVTLLSIAFLHSRGALGFSPAALMALLASAGMALSGSRASWGYMAIAFAIVPFLLRSGDPGTGRRFLRVVSLGFGIFVLVQVLNLYTDVFSGPEGHVRSAGDRFALYLEADIASSARPIRLQLFLYAWQMFLASPLLGVGFGEYAWRAFQLAADLPGLIPPGMDRHSHNLFLQLLAETGIAGFVCVAVPMLSLLTRTSWRDLTAERWWALAILAVIGLHSMVEFPLWHANFLGVFALLFGLASPGFAAVEASRVRRGLFLVVVAAAILTARAVWSDYRAFERWYLDLEATIARGVPADLSKLDVLVTHHEGSLFSPYFDRLLTETMTIDEKGLSDKLALNSQVVRLYPVPSVVHRQVALLALSGREEEAARLLRAAARAYPQPTEKWLPTLEGLARERPDRFDRLLAFARADLANVEQGAAFAPLAGKR